MDLSKAFNSISHDLLIAKMHVYGFSIDAATILGPLLLKILINDFYLWVSKMDLLHFADDTLSVQLKIPQRNLFPFRTRQSSYY